MMILGLTFLCTLVFNYLERFLIWCVVSTCRRKDHRIYSIITKQMDAHQIRNGKTSIMFTLSVSFLFFSASSFQLINTIIVKGFDKALGADIFIMNALPEGLLNEGPLAAYFTGLQEADEKLVKGYAFSSLDMHHTLELGEEQSQNLLFGAAQYNQHM